MSYFFSYPTSIDKDKIFHSFFYFIFNSFVHMILFSLKLTRVTSESTCAQHETKR
eukprot:UN02312